MSENSRLLSTTEPIQGSKHLTILYTDGKPILFLFAQTIKLNHRVHKFQLILMKFPILHIVWTEGKNLSLPDLLSCSLTTTTQNKHRFPTVEVPDSIKFFKTHNQNAQHIQCHYAVSKEYINAVSTDTTVESPHFPIYQQIKDNYFKVQLENDIYLSILYNEFQTKAQPSEQIHHNKIQQLKLIHLLLQAYPIIQNTDVTLNTNKTEPFIQFTQVAIDAELINIIKFSLPAMNDFIPKSPELYTYFCSEQTELNDTILPETQQQDPVIRQLLLWKRYKYHPFIPSLAIRANKGLLHY